MANHTDTVRAAAAEAGLTETEIDKIIERCGRHVIGGVVIGNRAQEEAAYQAIAHLQGKKKARRIGGPPATGRQVAYLRDLGATDDQLVDLTKAKASALIDQLKTARPARRTPADVARAHGRSYGIPGEIWDNA